jgi:hypothetical protein
LSLAAHAVYTTDALASWANNGNAASTATFDQTGARTAPDGAGGVIVVFEDLRNGGIADIYAQRFDASGAALWGNGVPVTNATLSQQAPVICSNGQGGAIVAWQDARNGTDYDIYAQALDANGNRLWTPADGVLICGATQNQILQVIAPDAVGGAIIAWRDSRPALFPDLYAQRVSGGGVTRWTANGIGVCTLGGTEAELQIISDQQGGAFFTWRDNRNGSMNIDVFGVAMDSTGAVRPGWTANGTAICTATGNQTEPTLLNDGRFGFIVAWRDERTVGAPKVFAQRMLPGGSAKWTGGGVEVAAITAANPTRPILATDGLAGAIVGWTDLRVGVPLRGYAQRVDSMGVRQWSPADGITLCAADSAQSSFAVVPDKVGGAIFAWTDARGAGSDNEIRAQAVSAAGALRWNPLGVAVCATTGPRTLASAMVDGYGGAYLAWEDKRSGNYDVYAFRITSVGTGVESPSVPATTVRLFPARPNPFNPHTTLEFSLETPSDFTLSIHDVQGRLVRRVAAGWRSAGRHTFTWDGRSDQGSECGSGTYYAALRTPAGVRSIPVTLVR